MPAADVEAVPPLAALPRGAVRHTLAVEVVEVVRARALWFPSTGRLIDFTRPQVGS